MQSENGTANFRIQLLTHVQEHRLFVDSFVLPFRINIKSYLLSCVVLAQRTRRICPGIESQRRRDFPRPSRPALVITQPSVQWLQVKTAET